MASLKIAVNTGDLKKAQLELNKLSKSGAKAQLATSKISQSFDGINKSAQTATASISKMQVAFVALGTVLAGNQLVKYADEMTMLSSKLKLVTDSTQELTEVQDELFKISQDARTGFADTADLYARMARSTKNTTMTQEDLLDVTDAISKSLIISGASAESANSALVQLGQGFAADALRGQELNSVLEQTPRLAQAIAEGLGVGLGELRAIAQEGKLTTEVTMNAIKSQGDAIQKEFEQMTMTVGQSTTKMDNSFLLMIGNLNDATGATRSLAKTFSDFSGSMDDNQSEIVAWGRFIYATIDRTIDIFNVLWEIIENGVQSLVYSLNIAVYGFASGVSKMALSVSEALNKVGALSDAELAQNRKLSRWLESEYKKAQQGIIDGGKEIQEALYRANETVEDRIKLMIKEEAQAKAVKQAMDDANEAKAKETQLTADQQKEVEKLTSKYFTLFSGMNSFAGYGQELEAMNDLMILQGEQQAEAILKAMETLKSPIEKVNEEFLAMHEVIKDIFDTEQMEAFYEKWAKEIETINKKEKDNDKEKYKQVGDTAQAYGLLASSMAGMYEEGSKEAENFRLLSEGLAIVAGVTAILEQGKGDPYTAFARMAMMAVTVASTLSSANINSSTPSISGDSVSMETANTGTGSVLGDINAQSESLANSLEILESFARPEFELMQQMTSSLKSIEYALAGVSANIVKTASFSIGEGFTGSDVYAMSVGEKYSELHNEQSEWVTSLFGDNVVTQIFGGFHNFAGDLVGSIVSGIFGGGTSVSKSLTDAGLYFNSQLLSTAMDDLYGREYQTIKTTTKKDGGWFSSDSTSIRYSTQYQALDEEIQTQFELILGSLYNTMLYSAVALDTSTTAVEDELSDFYVSLGKISLNGKTGEEIEEELTAIFGKIGDDMAKDAFPALVAFQQIGEGMFETLSRVSVGMQEAEYYINMLGGAFNDVVYTDIANQQGIVAVEALRQSIVEYDEAIFGASNGVVDMINLIETSAEDLYSTYLNLSKIRSQLAFTGGTTDGLTASMLIGAGGVDDLSKAFDSFFKNFLSDEEQLAYNTQAMEAEFGKLNLAMPASNDMFRSLLDSIDLTTADGQELYGRVILLSDGFSDLSSEMSSVNDSLIDFEINRTSTAIGTLESTFNSLNGVIDSLRGSSMSSATTLQDLYVSMDKTIALSTTPFIESFQDSLSTTIGLTSILSNSDLFASSNEQEYAKLRTASQFEDMAITVDDELSVLKDVKSSLEDLRDMQITQTATSDRQLTALRAILDELIEQNEEVA